MSKHKHKKNSRTKVKVKRKKKRKAMTAAKAKLILREGKAHGKKLTAKQKRFFGAIAGGQKPRKK